MKVKGNIGVVMVISIILAVLFESIALNKEYIRPAVSDHEILNTLSACFPSFITAYLISLMAISIALIKKLPNGRRIVYITSLWIFAILTIDEIFSGWGASKHFDKFDIVASGVGSLLAVATYEVALLIQKKKNKGFEESR